LEQQWKKDKYSVVIEARAGEMTGAMAGAEVEGVAVLGTMSGSIMAGAVRI
jgi:hypothetical protein